MSNPNAGSNRRKSRAQHELDGTYRKDRHGDLRNPEPPEGAPDMPEGLSDGATAEWQRMIRRLEQSKCLSKVDDGVLVQYCRLYDETESVAVDREHLAVAVDRLEENLTDFKDEDFLKLAQEITSQRKLLSKCVDQLRSGRMAIRQYLVEFGLTPASRGRIKLPPTKEPAADAFMEHQRARLSRVK